MKISLFHSLIRVLFCPSDVVEKFLIDGAKDMIAALKNGRNCSGGVKIIPHDKELLKRSESYAILPGIASLLRMTSA